MSEATTERVVRPAPNSTARQPGDQFLHMFCKLCFPEELDAPVTSLCGAVSRSRPLKPNRSQPKCIVCTDLLGSPCANGHPAWTDQRRSPE